VSSPDRQAAGTPHAAAAASRIARAVAVAPIAVYQRVLSPFLPRRCKYEPTCSHYAVDAIGEYGILRGAVLALWRLLRCNPWSYGGYDPVQDQRLFKVGHRPGRAHGS
jgi:putative membrane protein insertion efficiency factor